MVERRFCILVLAALIAGGVFAQEAEGENSEPAPGGAAPGFTGAVFINGGVGLGMSMGKALKTTEGYAISFLQVPVSASVDAKLPFNVQNPMGETFFTAGGFFYYSSLGSVWKVSDAGFGIRPAIHIAGLNFFEDLFKGADASKLHAYLAVPIGYVIQSWDGETNDEGSGFHLGLDLGTKYFIIQNLGLYAELNLNFRWMGGSIGLAARF
jgi:hypothetical protein